MGKFFNSLEVVQEFPDPTDGIPMIYEMIRGEAQYRPELKQCPFLAEGHRRFDRETLASKGISELLSELSVFAGKPFVALPAGAWTKSMIGASTSRSRLPTCTRRRSGSSANAARTSIR